jgi:hypothetical protein
MNYFFWFLLNIGIPVFGPIFFLALAAVSYGTTAAREMIFESVKDGQMYWTAIAVSTTGIYECWTPAFQNSPNLQVVLLTLAFVVVVSSVLVMLAEVKAYNLRQNTVLEATRQPWISSALSEEDTGVSATPTLALSFILTATAACVFAYAHSVVASLN